MADERDVWIRNIRAVEQEYAVARFSVRRSVRHARQDPSILPRGLRVRELDQTAAHLEGTYVIRLFAEFETALRAFFRSGRRRPPPVRTRDLLESVAAVVRIPPAALAKAHAVRDYRNVLIHERVRATASLTMAEARGGLCLYLSFLPRDW